MAASYGTAGAETGAEEAATGPQLPEKAGETISSRQPIKPKVIYVSISVRNKFPGTVKEIKKGGVVAEVIIQTGETTVVSVITNDAVDEMKLKVGDKVTALVKSTSVMIQK
ncbi:MAG TPA: TOBE domain-containing protein [Methanocella sp.]|nr:TOBE domain-containing protein [Methanocella sp.]